MQNAIDPQAHPVIVCQRKPIDTCCQAERLCPAHREINSDRLGRGRVAPTEVEGWIVAHHHRVAGQRQVVEILAVPRIRGGCWDRRVVGSH